MHNRQRSSVAWQACGTSVMLQWRSMKHSTLFATPKSQMSLVPTNQRGMLHLHTRRGKPHARRKTFSLHTQKIATRNRFRRSKSDENKSNTSASPQKKGKPHARRKRFLRSTTHNQKKAARNRLRRFKSDEKRCFKGTLVKQRYM